MPNKTIYVSDSDLPFFERAQQLLGGNLSATIAHALRKLVEERDPDPSVMRQIEVKVGKIAYSRKRFIGRLVAKGHVTERKSPPKVLEVYITEKSNVVLYTRTAPEFHHYPTVEDDSDWFSGEGEYTLEICQTLEELENRVPEELYLVAKHALGGNQFEYLDI